MTIQKAIENRILVAVDDSPASAHAVAYVGRLVGGSHGALIHLLHVLPPIPPAFLEHGGGTVDPEGMKKLGRETESRREQWIKECEKKAEPVLEKMKETLIRASVDKDAIQTGCYAPSPEESVAQGVLDTAKKKGFETIVVGRSSFPWYRDIVHRHVGDELKRETDGLSVWIVE